MEARGSQVTRMTLGRTGEPEVARPWIGIPELEEQVRAARIAVIAACPEPVQDLFRSAILCESIEEATRRETMAVDAVLALADPSDVGKEERAYCPLCGNGSSAPYARGFAFPEGLTRHLEGRSARRCPVFQEVWRLCIDAVWESGFDPMSGASSLTSAST